MQKTYIPNAEDVARDWYIIDADGQNLGRLASKIAAVILGKHKPNYTPGVNTGDYVIVINAERISVTGSKLDDKYYYRHSGYPGGFKQISLRDQLAKHPRRVVESAVRGMLPHNRFGRKLFKNLKVYAGQNHPHEAQQPKPLV